MIHLTSFLIAGKLPRFFLINNNDDSQAQELINELLTELSESIVRDFPEVMTTNKYLPFPEEDVVFELFESDNIISLFSGEHDEETDDDSISNSNETQ